MKKKDKHFVQLVILLSIQYLCWYFLLILDKFESLPFITCIKILIYQKIFTSVHLNAIFAHISLKGSIKLNLKLVPIVPTTWAPHIHRNRLQALIWVHLHWHHPSLNPDSNINLYSLWKILGTFLTKICQGLGLEIMAYQEDFKKRRVFSMMLVNV